MKEFPRRVIMTVAGVTIMGLSVGMFSFSQMGLDPFQVFCHGTWRLTNLDFGTYYMILNAVMLVLVFIFNRKKIGLGTVINLFIIGYISEWSENVLKTWIPNPGFAVRLLILILGIVIMCFSSALYYTADLGVSTYDAVAITIDEHHPKWKFKYIRICTDLVCVLIGWLLGATVGIGTIITAFFMGPLISFFRRTVSDPLRYGRQSKTGEQQ